MFFFLDNQGLWNWTEVSDNQDDDKILQVRNLIPK